ncbi:MAG: thiamine-phosphate pyrophosphorylase [Candidatus Saganbacteria bacterium]|uniref:Thiamine-phosphate pyrophosphorylase n=1 Tax=Candidatus Saganbacteria bacterium TaxID=2575572 RepID=A0A833L2N6_UNCSA|nr:MAG: thiamine-phosphate pyrophosphorylase [Candidatus Saganbacteria bacterium]
MKNIYRIIDANINRAMEGLRVVEEISRFLLEDKKITLKIKNLRAELKDAISSIPKNNLLSNRDSSGDVGGKLYTASEAKRTEIEDIFYSNIRRVEEAMRVLEEFSKLIYAKLGARFKNIRYKVYEAERQIAAIMVKYNKRG